MARETEHVVYIARFGGGCGQAVVELVWLAEVLVVTMTSGYVAVVVDDTLPEEICCGLISRVTCKFVKRGQSDQFRDLCVRVFSGQYVLRVGQRVEYGVMLKAAC
ncbi:MAG: hypothetical protein RI897_584 [Verrucomicrobiota bacterium]